MQAHESCERYEVDLSALLDGELGHGAISETLEHLRQCPECERFFEQLLQLERASELLPREDGTRAVVRARRERPYFLRNAWIAAALLLAFLGGWLLPTGELAANVPTRDEVLELSLGEDAGKMADARFVSMAVELLRADPRYHVAMFEMLQDVVEETPSEIPSPETFAFPR